MLRSGIALGAELGRAGERGVGETVLAAVRASRDAAGANTNLGIALLLAPLARAALTGGPLRERLGDVLRALTVDDARAAYAAIRLAGAGGLDEPVEHDVRDEPRVTLREAMAAAAQRDTIASEYVTDHAVTFELGLPALAGALDDGLRPRDAIVELALRLLAAVPDTLIARKRGPDAAGRVAAGARAGAQLPAACAAPAGRTALAAIRRLAAPGRQRAQPGDHGGSRHRRAVRRAAGGRALSSVGEPILLVSVSARMLAELAVRSRVRRRGPGPLRRSRPAAALPERLRAARPRRSRRHGGAGGRGGGDPAPSVIYGAGLENQPDLVARLASGRTAARVHGPRRSSACATRRRWAPPCARRASPTRRRSAPPTRRGGPSARRRWLRKPVRGGGGRGVREWRGGALDGRGRGAGAHLGPRMLGRGGRRRALGRPARRQRAADRPPLARRRADTRGAETSCRRGSARRSDARWP